MKIDTVNITIQLPAVPARASGFDAFVASLAAGSAFPGANAETRTDTSSPPPVSADTPSKTPRIGEEWPGQGGVFAGMVRGAGGRPEAFLIVGIAAEAKLSDVMLGTYGVDVLGAVDRWDGRANTVALAGAGSELCKRILDSQIDGHGDWYLMSRGEAALCYANVPELFERGWHLTSTQYSEYTAWTQGFYDGSQDDSYKKFEARARLVRRLIL